MSYFELKICSGYFFVQLLQEIGLFNNFQLLAHTGASFAFQIILYFILQGPLSAYYQWRGWPFTDATLLQLNVKDQLKKYFIRFFNS